MTTMIERPRASSSGAMGASNMRHYLIALLAAAYVVAWWLLGIRASATPDEALAIEPTPEASAEPAIVTWFHDLPPANRPVVNLPAGWRIADRTTSSPAVTARAVPVPVRVSPARAGRIRTRSS